MRNVMTLFAGLTVVAVCMADISGTVTDTGTTPIAGAVVQLEEGGQTATSGPDGRFTIVTSTAIISGNSRTLPNSLSVRISGNILTVTIAEQTALEVATFDLNGKFLSTVHKALDVGTHSIELPQRSPGIYLYKVKSGNREFVLKGNAFYGISLGSSATTQGSSSNKLAKRAKTAAAINDVIAATKTGYLNYRCVQYNSDTTGVAIKMIVSAGTVTDTDGNVYQTVKIGNQVWTVENFRVTKYNDGTAIPKDTSSATWNAVTPKYCFYNNTTNADSIKRFGALYNWYVVDPANVKKIAPTGWHVPSDSEWTIMENYLIANGYNWDGTITGNKIAKSLAGQTDWFTSPFTGEIGNNLNGNNSSGFSALGGGYRIYNGYFNVIGYDGRWWSATASDASSAYDRYLHCYGLDGLSRDDDLKSCGFSVRLLRDN